MKLINKVKVILIILIAVTIIFAILGAFNLYPVHEGMDDVPKCAGSLSDDEDDKSDYWALKSQIIPPVCPTCPYYDFKGTNSKGSEYKSDGSSNSGTKGWSGFNIGNSDVKEGDITDTRINTDNSIINKVTDNSEQNKTEINKNVTNTDINQQSSQSQNINQDNSVNQDMSQTETKTEESKFNNLLGNNSIMFGSFGGGGSNSQTANNNNNGSLPVSTPAPAGSTSSAPYAQQGPDNTTLGMINDLKGSISKLNQQKPDDKKEQCPPCPACERCPEPAFECKKVPNYRSPSIDNYMPVPVLNDFSRF
jgi:hypothetical protein